MQARLVSHPTPILRSIVDAPLAERPAIHILPRDPHINPLTHERPNRKRLRSRSVQPVLLLQRREAVLHVLPQARVDLKALKLVRLTARSSLGSMTVAGPCAALGPRAGGVYESYPL